MNLPEKPIDSSMIQILQESPDALRAFLAHMRRSTGEPYEEESINFLHSLVTSRENYQLERIVFISMGKTDNISPEFFSLLLNRVEIIEILSDSNGYEILYTLYLSGSLAYQDSAIHTINDPGLITASINHLINKYETSENCSTAVIFHKPEEEPVLAETLTGALNAPFYLFFEKARYNQSILRLENAAKKCYVPDEQTLIAWKQQHVVTAEIGHPKEFKLLAQAITDQAQIEALPRETSEKSKSSDHRVLIVSYFSLPTTLVSTQRLSYWHQSLEEIAAEVEVDLEVIWLSATTNAKLFPKNRVIRDRGNFLVSPQARNSLNKATKIGVPSLGLSWSDYVKEETQEWDEQFDTVIISVGPFGYLELGGFFKQLWGSHIIYDFRDPYGGDARMVFSKEQREWIDRHEEDNVNRGDVVVSVNEQCLSVIAPNVEIERVIVNNGYNETVVNKALHTHPHNREGSDLIKFVYCGTIFRDRGIDEFVTAFSVGRHKLIHFGRDQTNSKILVSHEATEQRGFITDKSVLASEMLNCDAGILRLGGEGTTGTTKIFDYIGCDLDIIIITDGKLESGAVHDLTKDLEGIYWVKNSPRALKQFLKTYSPTRSKRKKRDTYSRRHQASILLDLILKSQVNSGAH